MTKSFIKNILSTLFLLAGLASYAQNDSAFYVNFKQLDELTSDVLYGDQDFLGDNQLQYYINLDKSYLPQYTEEDIRKQFALIPTTIPLTYNKEIDVLLKYFLFKRREYVTRMLTHSQYYFPLFEESLDKKNLPIELKVLPVVESALNSGARSWVGATGLWQIMHGTATGLGLKINTLVDERNDPDKSTEAATEYLRKLHDIYNDWLLALAAYNSGPGNVNRAIRECGGVKDFWRIKHRLPKETQNYVPSFIAMVYIFNFHKNYHLYPAKPKINIFDVQKEIITEQLSLKYVAEVLGVEEELLRYLNPSLRKGIVPKTENGFPLNIPVNKAEVFSAKKQYLYFDPYLSKPEPVVTRNESSSNSGESSSVSGTPSINGEIISSSKEYTKDGKVIESEEEDSYANPVTEEKSESTLKKFYHKVKKGEILKSIANKYNVTLSNLLSWNKLKKNSKLKSGQSIIVYKPTTAKKKSLKPTLLIDEAEEEHKSTITSHKIKKGETLMSVSRKYGYSVNDLKKWNKLKSGNVKVGQIIKFKEPSNATKDEPKSSTKKAATKTEKTTKSSNKKAKSYTVKKGDTLYEIAKKNDVTVDEIKKANKLKGNALKPGTAIKIPR